MGEEEEEVTNKEWGDIYINSGRAISNNSNGWERGDKVQERVVWGRVCVWRAVQYEDEPSTNKRGGEGGYSSL